MSLSRRSLLRAGAATGMLLLGAPTGGFTTALRTATGMGASRVSRLSPGQRLAHADLHNHSHLSDGAGDETFAYQSMRDAGLDVAALTDHSTLSYGALSRADPCAFEDPAHGERGDCRSLAGLNEDAWQRTGELADDADVPGRFTAIRGFEWSSPFLGHVNVWFSSRWIDPLHTSGIDSSGLGEHFRQVPAGGGEIGAILDELGRSNPAHTGMRPFYQWLRMDPSTPVLGGGLDGIAGFNHPGRETGRFSYFQHAPVVDDQFVSLEILNRREDYLFKSWGAGQPSPLVECLNAGWRVGLSGVTDEHGADWGFPQGKGRTGLWIGDLSRAGAREALEARRFFATREAGLRLDARARPRPGRGAPPFPGGGWARMGTALDHRDGPVQFQVDIDLGEAAAGMPISVQVLRPDDAAPRVVHIEDTVVPAPDQPVIAFSVDLAADEGGWVVLRVADPSRPSDAPGPEGHPCNTFALGYASPFWLSPDAVEVRSG